MAVAFPIHFGINRSREGVSSGASSPALHDEPGHGEDETSSEPFCLPSIDLVPYTLFLDFLARLLCPLKQPRLPREWWHALTRLIRHLVRQENCRDVENAGVLR